MGYQGNYPPSTPLNPTQLGTGVVTTDAIANGAVIPADLSTGGPYWNTSGQVFVGNSTNLTVSGVSNSGFAVQSTGGAARILISRLSNDISSPALFGAKSRSTTFGSFAAVASGDDLFDMRFNGDDGSTLNTYPAQIKAIVTGAVSTGVIPAALTFSTAASGNATERMRIDSSGNVGIGTTSPSSYGLLAISKAGVTTFAINNSSAAATGYIQVDNGSYFNIFSAGTVFIGPTGANPLLFQTNNTERMRIDSSGNVGIGTTSPSTSLTVDNKGGGSTPTSGGVRVTQTGWTGSYGYFEFDTINTVVKLGATSTSYPLSFQTNSTERMRIDTSGNVGIGTTSTNSKLEVSGANANTTGGSQIRASNTTGTTRISLAADGANNKVYFIAGGSSTNPSFNWANNDSYLQTHMTLDTSGNLGIGTTTPSQILHVKSGNGIIYTETTAARNSNNNYISFRDSTGEAAFIGFGNSNANFYYWNSLNGAALFATNNTERMRIDSSGNLLVGASSQIGSEKFGVTSGTTNATQYTTIATKGGSSFYIEQQQTTSVSTTATAILASPKYCTFCLVHGSDGTNRFSDVVLMSVGTGTVNVISSLSASGTPSARTYSQSSSTLRVAMGSGTYTVQATSLNMTS